MNERLEKFVKQAPLLKSYDYPDLRLVDDDQLERFAELIIHECVEQIRLKGTDWIDFAPSQMGIRPEYVDMAKHIKEHFGVE